MVQRVKWASRTHGKFFVLSLRTITFVSRVLHVLKKIFSQANLSEDSNTNSQNALSETEATYGYENPRQAKHVWILWKTNFKVKTFKIINQVLNMYLYSWSCSKFFYQSRYGLLINKTIDAKYYLTRNPIGFCLVENKIRTTW